MASTIDYYIKIGYPEALILPFLAKKNQNAGVIVQTRKPDEEKQDSGSEGFVSCAQDLINAIHSKDAKAVAQAFKDLFELAELEPHEEAPHSYDAQNIKAGENE